MRTIMQTTLKTAPSPCVMALTGSSRYVLSRFRTAEFDLVIPPLWQEDWAKSGGSVTREL